MNPRPWETLMLLFVSCFFCFAAALLDLFWVCIAMSNDDNVQSSSKHSFTWVGRLGSLSLLHNFQNFHFAHSCSLPVWPDLAKLRQFRKNGQVFGICSKVYFLFGNMMGLLWQIWYIIGLVFIVVNFQISKNNLAIWSHCSLPNIVLTDSSWILMVVKPVNLTTRVRILFSISPK